MPVTSDSTPKSEPDFSKLKSMMSPVVTVTKGRRGASQSVIAGEKGLTVDDILKLPETIVAKYGPGIYKFTVFDEAGDGKEKDSWTNQLGAVASREQDDMSGTASGTSAAPFSSQPSAAQIEGAVTIAPGLLYNEDFGFLYSVHTRQMYPWRRGDQWPAALAAPVGSANNANSATANGASTPWTPPIPGMPFPPGWGGYPAFGGQSSEDDKIKELEAKLAAQEAQRREDAHKRELEGVRAEVREIQNATTSAIKELTAAIATIAEKKPEGPSPEMVAMQAKLDAAEKRAEDDRREAEARRREDEFKRELEASRQETAKMVAEIQNNKGDATLTMMTQLMGTMQQSNATMMASIEKASQAAAEGSREYMRLMSDRMSSSAMTPEKTVELIRLAKDNGPQAEANKGLAEMYSTVFGMAKDLLVLRAEMDGPGEPAWLPMARDAVGRIGSVAQAVAQTKAREEARHEAEARRAAADRAHAIRARRMAQASAQPPGMASVPQAPQVPPAPADNRTEAQKIRDAAAAEMGLHAEPAPDSPQAIRDAAAADMGLTPGGAKVDAPAGAAENAAPAATPLEGPNLTVVPDAVQSPNGTVEALSSDAAAAATGFVATEDGVVAPVADPETIEGEDADTVRQAVANIPDDQFFGAVYGHVQKLRAEVGDGSGLDVGQCADFVLQAVEFLNGASEYPPALELLHNQHADIMLERLLPDAAPEYREALGQELERIGNEAVTDTGAQV